MGDTAEGIFDRVHPKNHPLGLNRPPFFMGKMTAAMRYTPDRMDGTRIIECMGIGRDGKLKIKVEKLTALDCWEAIGPTWLFVYHQGQDTYYEAAVADWNRAALTHGLRKQFPEGKEYFELYYKDFPTDPLPVPEALDAVA